MKTLLNIVWFLLAGVWLWIPYALAALVMCVLIVTIPCGIVSFRIANFAVWPFGRTYVDKPTAGAGSLIGNIIWVRPGGSVNRHRTRRHRQRAGRHDHRAADGVGESQDDFPLGKEIVPDNAARAGVNGGSVPSPTMSRY